MPGGLYDCLTQALPDGHLLLEFYELKLELQLMQLQQREVQTGMLDLLRRNLGHELRNPLGGIRGAAQMLAGELEDQELGTLARLIMREVDRIEELIKRFGQPRLSHAKADLHKVIDEALELLQAESGGRVTVERDYDPSIPMLPGDASALRRVVLNLVRNAEQAGAGQIRLRTRVEHGAALLQPGQGMLARTDVEDDGEGVPEELRALLFLPLVTGRRDGTGLGLAMAQQIAAAHGGLLSYEALPTGSRFSLRLPLNGQAQSAEQVHD
jgi:two-component system nitrogen regulation sensor histidine kinase GlnL